MPMHQLKTFVQKEFSEREEILFWSWIEKLCWPYTEYKDCITTLHQQLADLVACFLSEPKHIICAKGT